MENEIDALVRLFEAKVGLDLETYTTHNTLWHTGNPLDMRAAANLKRGRPWEWIWCVAFGRSCSKHRSRHETWHAFAGRFVDERFFPF